MGAVRRPDPADACAEAIVAAFASYHVRFKTIARRAPARFATRDWHGGVRDARERLELYGSEVRGALSTLQRLLGGRLRDPEVWKVIKPRVAERVADRPDAELAETFLNSVTRRVFATVGVNPEIEFVASDARPPAPARFPAFRTYACEVGVRDALARMLGDLGLRVRWRGLERDLTLAAERVEAALARETGDDTPDGIDVLRAPFYRNKGAYVVARMRCRGRVVPLLLPLVHGPDGVSIDAVLTDEDDVSIVFSFTRSYFLVESERPCEIVEFLRSILPRKRVSELYISIGYDKHGKTELYRDLLRHLSTTDDRFVPARGSKGMVMSVFTLASYDVVFKVIKDKFDPPKTSTRTDVLAAYNYVFKRDRAGRLVDTQEFEHLTFRRERFSDEVIEELARVAPSAVSVDHDELTIRHLYTERRLVPLNLYVREAPLERACAAVVDFGRAIKDLAAANVFPGDTLLKNFGVTRHGRVAFYDYDEVRPLTDCLFRRMPPARSFEDEIAEEAWFAVGERDIFPEEFRSFLGLEGALRAAFEREHADLYGVEFWTDAQRRILAGEVADIFPYRDELRLPAG
jgi:isocitrate dehydrogenase kinase/phosphatase